MNAPAPASPAPRRFRIALSFPGEHRPFVEQVAEQLAAAVGRERVLYDRFYEAELARPDLDTYLQRLYHDESELIAVFLCAAYERKEWCGLEWRAVRDLIKRRQAASVMPLRFDNTEIPGLFSIDGYIWIDDRSPEDIADLIFERWRLNSGEPFSALSKVPPWKAAAEPARPIEPKGFDEFRIDGEGFVGRLVREPPQDFAAALKNLDFGELPSLLETLRTSKPLSVPLIDLVLGDSELPPEKLDPFLKGEQLTSAKEKLAESLARTEKEASVLQDRLAKLQTQEQDLSAQIERIEKERPSMPPKPSESDLLSYRMGIEWHLLEGYRRQLDEVRREAKLKSSSLVRIQQDRKREQSRLEGEVAAARAREIVHLLREMRDRGLRLVEEPETTGEGFLLLLSIALVTPALSRHLTHYTAEAAWADEIAQRVSGKAEAAVRRDPQAVARDLLALALTIQEGMEEGEQTITKVRRILDSVPAEALQLFVAEQRRLLRFAPPKVESHEARVSPDDIAEAAARVERRKVDLAGILDEIRVIETETAEFEEVTDAANRSAEELRQRWSHDIGSLLPRLEDCGRIWTLLARAEESPALGRDIRRFCSCLRAEGERRLGEPLESLLARCKSRKFGLEDVKADCAMHPVRTYLTQAEELRGRIPKFESLAADLDRDGRRLAGLPRHRAQEYRRKLRFAVLWAVFPLLGFVGALRGWILIRRFAQALRSHHQDYRNLTRWSLPWLLSAVLGSTLGAIGLGVAISPFLAGSNPRWATLLALSALGPGLWTVQSVWVLFLHWKKGWIERRDRKREDELRQLEARWTLTKRPSASAKDVSGLSKPPSS